MSGFREPAGTPVPSPLDLQVEREQVRLVYATIRTASVGDSLLAFLFGGVIYWISGNQLVFVWLALHVYNSLRYPVMGGYFKDAHRDDPQRVRYWADTYSHELRFNSLVWGMAPILFLDQSLTLASLVMVVIMGFCMAGVMAVAPLRKATYGYLIPMNVCLVLGLLSRFSIPHLVLACCATIFLVMVVHFGRAQNRLLTESLRARFEKAELAERLKQQVETTERVSHEKTRFLAAASHDLRQPLHAIALLGAALEKQLTDRPEQINAKRLMSAVNTLERSLDSMLDVSRLDAGVVQVERRPVSLQSLFQSLNQGFVDAASAKDIALRFRTTNLWVDSDPQLLRRLLSNLIDNAIKYTHRGGVLVVARAVRTGRESGVWVEVYDTGIGISSDQQLRVFEEFYQINNPGRDRALGLGIGLSIVSRLSHLLGHAVELDSSEGRGTRFRIHLPAAAAAESASRNCRADWKPDTTRQLPKKVLLLDDEADVRTAMQQLLAVHGVELVTAANETEARARLAEAVDAQQCELMICDYRLAEEADGLDVGRRLTQAFAMPLLLITGETAPERLQRVMDAGVPVLFKPVNVELLLETLAVVVKRAST